MPTAIKDLIGSATAIGLSPASLADGSARQSDAITNTGSTPRKLRVFGKVTTGTSPTANSNIQFFISRADETGSPTLSSGGTSGTDSAYSGTKGELKFLDALRVSSASDTEYWIEFEIKNPGPDCRIVMWNETGAALNATAGNFEFWYRTEDEELQTA